MKETLIIAGFGGQGVLSMGKILAYSGVMQDYEVTWMPSYGPEMRGGTANVTVILSDRKISSPIAHEFDTAIILNQQSMEKFESMVKPGGVLIYDTNGITRHPVRTDISVYAIDATAECAKMGQAKLFNTMILGGYLKVCPVVANPVIVDSMKRARLFQSGPFRLFCRCIFFRLEIDVIEFEFGFHHCSGCSVDTPPEYVQ